MKTFKLLLQAFVIIGEGLQSLFARIEKYRNEKRQKKIKNNVDDELRDRGWLSDDVRNGGVLPEDSETDKPESGR